MALAPGSGSVRILLVLAMAVGLGAAAWVQLLQARIDEARRPEDRLTVVIAARDLHSGVTITEDDLYAVAIAPRYLPEGAFLDPVAVVGRVPSERILANEPVRAERLADPESGTGLNGLLPRGMRALSVSVRDGAALSGFLRPGNLVDVLVTSPPEVPDAHPRTEKLLEAIAVLRVDRGVRAEGRPPAVTLLVTRAEAERIAHAERVGDIVLSLRVDHGITPGEDVDRYRRRRTRDVTERRCQEIEIVEGGSRRTVLVDDEGNPCRSLKHWGPAHVR